MSVHKETIVAIITAQGQSAMGAIRLSGPESFSISREIFKSKSGLSVEEMGRYHLAFGWILKDRAILDQGLLLKMQGPTSMTGEDVIEIQSHGGPWVLNEILLQAQALGARLAMPGEFTQRAFLNGKLDLSQAEAIMDLIGANNTIIGKTAAAQMQGSLTRHIQGFKAQLIHWLAAIEVDIDFPDEDVSTYDRQILVTDLQNLHNEISQLLETAAYGRIYREGLRLVFYGRPNVGKSSLLNGLLQQKRAIVTDEAGTTRDVLEERFMVQGIPIILMDTAGIRQTDSKAEQYGVERAKEAAQKADFVLFVLDLSEGFTQEDQGLLRDLDPQKTLVIANKSDLAPDLDREDLAVLKDWDYCILSALDQRGIAILIEEIKRRFLKGDMVTKKTEVLINQRQEGALKKAQAALTQAIQGLVQELPGDLVAIDLKIAWEALGEITGESLQESLVEELFTSFCLGK